MIGLIYSSRRPRPEPEQDTRLRALLRQHHSSNIEWMLTWTGNTVWFSDDGRTAIGYEVVGIGGAGASPTRSGRSTSARRRCASSTGTASTGAGSRACSPPGQATADLAPGARLAARSRWPRTAWWPSTDLEFKGKAWQDVRTAINKAGKQDIALVVTSWADATPVVTDQLRAISGGWVSDKSLPEMGFTLGTLREADDPEVRLHLAVDADQTDRGLHVVDAGRPRRRRSWGGRST